MNFEDPRFTNLSLELLDKVYETYKEELEVGDEHLVVLDEVQEITALVKAMDEFELKEGINITEDKMKSFLEEYSRIIGFILLMFVVILHLATPSLILAHAITMIDTELSYATDDALTVRSKLDFGNSEHMRALSNEIGGWIGSD